MERRRVRDEPAAPQHPQPAAAPAEAPILALQRSAGNAAVTRRLLSRDIKPGDKLPDLDAQLRRRVDKQTRSPAPADIPDRVLLDTARQETLTAAVSLTLFGQSRQQERDAAVRVLQAFLGVTSYRGSVNQIEQAANDVDPDLAEGRGPAFKSVGELVAKFLDSVEKLAVNDARLAAIKGREDQLKSRTIAKPLDPESKKKLSTALKRMDFIQLILGNKKRDPAPTEDVRSAGWSDGGSLQDDIRIDTENMPADKQIRDDIDKNLIQPRIAEADRFIKLMVEPEQLGAIKRPKVVVHTKWAEAAVFSPTSWFDSNVFRAFQSGDEVHIAQNEQTWIVVHEVGHYLEKELPLEAWTDIRALIQARHAEAKPTDPSRAVGGRGSSSEGGFAGAYPATGKYTSRAYATGDTEMMSLTVEYLKNPAKTLDLLDADPVQAAVVLRHLRPKDYAANVGGDFDAYLPSERVAVTV